MSKLRSIFLESASIAPLVSLRIAFGLLMCFSALRFWYYGWIDQFYIQPEYWFSYPGFDWVKPLPGIGMYIIFAMMAVSALGIALGAFYRLSAALFFLSFSYVELIDKTTYLNHYYFVSLMAFLLILLPAHRRCSVDARRNPAIRLSTVPAWVVMVPKLQLSIVYFYAGLAKLHSDWLFKALPLKIWLPPKAALPLIGWALKYELTAYLFSWFGAIYDLFIPFFLWWRKAAFWAFLAVIAFHVLTWILFPIGIFPWVMIFSTTIFLPVKWHEWLISKLEGSTPLISGVFTPSKVVPAILGCFFLIQLSFPMRYLLYPGNVLWHEQGFRFSWRVMLVEKNGHVQYKIRDKETGATGLAYPSDHLSPLQEKQMSFQPDMILQYAHYIAELYKVEGKDVEVYAESFVSYNGRDHRRYIDPTIDLCTVTDDWSPREWVLPYEN